MSLYVDTSALLKRYIDEPDSDRCEEYLLSDPTWITGRHTGIEVRRNLARLLANEALADARRFFAEDWARMHVVELDRTTCDSAADLAEMTGVRTLDALHLAAAMRVGIDAVTLLTFDIRQAQAARQLHLRVLGA